MRKILLVFGLIANISNSYASQDRSYFPSYSYMRLNRQEGSRLITRIINALEREREIITQSAEIMVDVARYIPHTATKLVDITMPAYEKSIYFYLANKDLK